MTGLRGVGKTVLLGAFREIADGRGWATVEAEVAKNIEFGLRMAQLLRRALLTVAPKARWTDRAKRAASVLRAFNLTVSPDGSLAAGLDVDPAVGLADSGILSEDLTDTFVALGEVARDNENGIVFLFDEVQYLDVVEFEALIAALHKTVQRNLPITLVGAGLPQIPRLAGEAKSYAERLFKFPAIGRLPDDEAARALADPAATLQVVYEGPALAEITRYTEGYPYFLQEYGKLLWDESPDRTISIDDVSRVRPLVEAQLDANFFQVRADRVTELELRYLRAMAHLGPEAQKASDVARVLKRTSEQLGPVRARLIDKGLLYTPGHGLAAFTVPQFDQYMIRNHDLVVPAQRRRR